MFSKFPYLFTRMHNIPLGRKISRCQNEGRENNNVLQEMYTPRPRNPICLHNGTFLKKFERIPGCVKPPISCIRFLMPLVIKDGLRIFRISSQIYLSV
jgi:hypothetical protein